MNLIITQIQTLFVALVLFIASGGHTIYEHLCKDEQEACALSDRISFAEDDHKTMSCCSKFSNDHEFQDKCCDDVSDFDTQDQVQISIDHSFFQGLAILSNRVYVNSYQALLPQQKYVAFFNKPPPRYKTHIIIQFQQFLC